MILHARGATGRRLAVALFVLQLAMNYSWSPLFFAAHEVGAALILIVLMVILSAACAFLFGRIRKAAGLLMLPYIAWLLFAGYLTWQIGQLNPNAAELVPADASADIPL
jgi:tryptophan-rich sensory protein